MDDPHGDTPRSTINRRNRESGSSSDSDENAVRLVNIYNNRYIKNSFII